MRTSPQRVRHRLVGLGAVALITVGSWSLGVSQVGAATTSTRPDTTAPDTTAPDTTSPDTTSPDTTSLDSSVRGSTADSTVPGSTATARSTTVPTAAVSLKSPIYSAVMGVTVEDPLEGARQTTNAAEKVGGVRFAETIANGRVEITVKVPPGDFQSTVDAVARLGTVRRRTITTDEVTSEFTDLQARVDSARLSRDRIDALLGAATRTADVVELERALEQRQTTLEQLQGQLRVAQARVALSTITVTFVTPPHAAQLSAPRHTPPGFGRGLSNGWRALRDGGSWVLAAVGASLPFLLVLGVLTLIVRPMLPGRARRGPTDIAPGSEPRTPRGRKGEAVGTEPGELPASGDVHDDADVDHVANPELGPGHLTP